jgi:glucokinase
MSSKILAGDIGGTKVNLAIFQASDSGLEIHREQSYPSQKFDTFYSILEDFLPRISSGGLDHACFGVAGPVHRGKCQVTYLPWVIEEEKLQDRLNGVLAAGTGLGQAFLFPNPEKKYLIVETEGGQCDFPARTLLDTEILIHFREKLGRVKVEDILSGPGLGRLYRFLRDRSAQPEPTWLQGIRDGTVISQAGLEEKDPVCQQALEVFVSLYGAVAGNLALQILARGGIYLAGGIAPKILPWLQSDRFLKAFRGKGEFREFMEKVPVRVLRDDRLPLWGAAHFALGETFIRW